MPVHLLNAHAGITGLLLAAPTKKSSSSPIFLYLIVVLLGVYLLWLRPQKKRQQAAARAQHQAEVGDEVITTSGIYGKVLGFDGDRVEIEIAPGTTIEIARRALGQRVDPVTIEPDAADEEPPGGTGFGHPGYDGHDDLDADDTPRGSTGAGPTGSGSTGGGSQDFSAGWHDTAAEGEGEGEGDEKAPGGAS